MLLQQLPKRKLIISLTPLIDVVFILLIFFLLASNFKRSAEYMVHTDTAASAVHAQQLATITVTNAGHYQLNGDAINAGDIRVALLVLQAQAGAIPLRVVVDMAPASTLQAALVAHDIATSAKLAVTLAPRAHSTSEHGPVSREQP